MEKELDTAVTRSGRYDSWYGKITRFGTVQEYHRNLLDAGGSLGRSVYALGRSCTWQFTRSKHFGTFLTRSAYPVVYQGNVLLDSVLHCQITGFVSSENSDISVTPSSSTLLTNFAAPELFDDVDGDLDVQKRMQIDVYAFGCLYYTVRFNCSLTCSVHWVVTGTDILWYSTFSWEKQLSNHATRQKRKTSRSTRTA